MTDIVYRFALWSHRRRMRGAPSVGSIVFVGFMSFTIAYYAAHVVWYFIR